MSALRTMNRRRWRRENPATWPTVVHSLRADGTLRIAAEAIRGGHYVRYSPRPFTVEDFEDFEA